MATTINRKFSKKKRKYSSKRIFIILISFGKATQNNFEVSSYHIQNVKINKTANSCREDSGDCKYSFTVGETANWSSHSQNQCGQFSESQK